MTQRTSDQFHCTSRILWCVLILCGSMAMAQPQSIPAPPSVAVFTDDSPQAQDSLARAQTHLASGNQIEALRLYQRLLEEFPTRLVVDPGRTANIFVSVRNAVHQAIRSNDDLLAQYTQTQQDRGDRLLERGEFESVYRSFFLCPAGLEATLVLAEHALMRGQFDSAQLLSKEALDHPALDEIARRRAVFVRAWSLAATGDRGQALHLLDELALEDPRPDDARDRLRHDLTGLDLPGAARPVSAAQSLVDPQLQDLGRSPTWRSAVRQPASVAMQAISSRRNTLDDPTMPDDPARLAVMPVVAADLVCVHDGSVLRGLDRFDGRERWSRDYTNLMTRPSAGTRRNSPTSLQNDPSIPIVESDRVLAVMNGTSARGDGTSLLVCHHLDSGQPMWITTPGDLHPELTGGQFIGFPAADEGRAVLLVRKQTLRLASDYVVAVDVTDGTYLWHQHVASTAIFGFYAILPSIAPSINGGMVFVSTPLGAIAAINARSGLVHWLRLWKPLTSRSSSAGDPPWAFDMPVAAPSQVYAFTPNRLNVVSLDRETGDEFARAPVTDVGFPTYLVGSGKTVLAVGKKVARLTISQSSIIAAPFDLPWRMNEGIIGRVAVGDQRALIPTSQRLILTDLNGTPLAQVEVQQISVPLLVGGEVLLAGARYIESYIPFEIGEPQLRARLERDPTDPNPAISLARLAFQHRKLDVLLESVDHAIEIIEADPRSELNFQAQDRLFTGLLDMAPNPVLPEELSSALFARLDMIAAMPSQRLAYLLNFGGHLARRDQVAAAIDSYQTILSLPALGLETWNEKGATRSAVDVATDRIAALIATQGAGLYQPYDNQAQRQWAGLLPDPSPAEALALARRFPFSSVATQACLTAARALGSRRASDAAAREEALGALRFGLSLADTADVKAPDLVSELMTLLLELNRYPEARRVLRTIQRRDPKAMIPDREGLEMSIAQWRTSINDRAGPEGARPRLGEVGALADIRDGERLMVPPSGTPSARIALIREGLSLIGLTSDGQMKFIERLDSSNKEVITAQPDHVILASLSSREPRTINRFSLTKQQMEWTTLTFDEFFDQPSPNPRGGQLRAAVTDTSVILAEDYGRAACIDRQDGHIKWAIETGLDQLRSFESQPFAVVLAGEKLAPGSRRSRREVESNLLRILNPETGKVIFARDGEAYEPFSDVHLSEAGLLVYRAAGAFHGVDVISGRPVWTTESALLSDPEWSAIAGSTLLVFRESGSLVTVDLRTGHAQKTDAIRPIERQELAPSLKEFNDRFILRTHNGVYIVEDDGRVTGLMAGSGSPKLSVLSVAAAADRIIAVLSIDQQSRGLPRTIEIAQLDETGRNLDLPFELDQRTESPRTDGLLLINGAILIDAGRDVIIIPAPVEDPPNS